MINLFKIAKAIATKVQENNKRDPNVKTADGSVFDKMFERFDKSKQEAEVAQPKDLGEVYKQLEKQVSEVKVENEADPKVETADTSVFDNMMKEIEELKKKVAEQENASTSPAPGASNSPSTSHAAADMMAMTNSNGGSLALRMEPDMGSAINSVRVPEFSLLRVIEYTDKSINLDGKTSRFVLVEYEGQQGYLLESYLNFN